MIAASRSVRPRVSAPSLLVEVLPPPVSGAPTGALRVLVGVRDDGPGDDGPGDDGPGEDGPGEDGPGEDGPGEDGPGEDGPVVGAVAVGEVPAMTGRGDAEVVTVRLWDGVPVGVVPPSLYKKTIINEAKM